VLHDALLLVAVVATGAFAGAAAYVSLVEHPARVSCGVQLALTAFGPSYKRGAVMQASLAMIGTAAGLGVAWRDSDGWYALAALLLGGLVPFTLIVIFPTNARLLDPSLAADEPSALLLLRRWGTLHAVRTVASCAAFLIITLRAIDALG
jgi:hypothetical protein